MSIRDAQALRGGGGTRHFPEFGATRKVESQISWGGDLPDEWTWGRKGPYSKTSETWQWLGSKIVRTPSVAQKKKTNPSQVQSKPIANGKGHIKGVEQYAKKEPTTAEKSGLKENLIRDENPTKPNMGEEKVG